MRPGAGRATCRTGDGRKRRRPSLLADELNRVGIRLYERFRPEVPEGVEGWGAGVLLDSGRIKRGGGLMSLPLHVAEPRGSGATVRQGAPP